MLINDKIIKLFLEVLQKENIVSSINQVNLFFDEPRMFQYGSILNYISKYSDGFVPKNSFSASGVSFFSKEEALFKCLAESVERYCLAVYKNKNLLFTKHPPFSSNYLNPSTYLDNKSTKNGLFGWVKGFDLTSNKPSFIPAQLMYLNYQNKKKEPRLTYRISTGAAGGFTRDSALLRGIYEVVERDAFMTMYLGKISPPRIDIESFKDDRVQSLFEYFKRYKLDWCAFDISNDLGVATYMSILIDKTGVGPAVSVGLKSGTDLSKLIFASVGEALMVRIHIRGELTRRKNLPAINRRHIHTVIERGLYWSPVSMLNKLDFILRQKNHFATITKKQASGNELQSLIRSLAKQNHAVYYSNLSLPFMKDVGFFVYKAVIPTLQPLYLDESQKEFRLERLRAVAEYFGKKFNKINPIPHPFL